MLAPTSSPASKTTGSIPRSTRCAAAASPTGPAPITATTCGFSVMATPRSRHRRISMSPRYHQIGKASSFFDMMVGMPTPLPLVQCCAPLGSGALSDGEALELEQVFKALADRHRVKILNRLLSAGGEAVCVCDFEELLGLKQPTVSYHLKQLLSAGIVTRERRGAFAYYAIADGALERVCALLGYATPAVA